LTPVAGEAAAIAVSASTASAVVVVQGGGDPQDAFSCRSFFVKEPIITGLFGGK